MLASCAILDESKLGVYQLQSMQHLQIDNWSFEGRLSIVNAKESYSVSVNWQHEAGKDIINLSAPLLQGSLLITIMQGKVLLDNGESLQILSGNPDEIISSELGVDFPISSLIFWMQGNTDPSQANFETENGFEQMGWLVKFQEMQMINNQLLPRKLSVEKNNTKIKLILDQWTLRDK